VMSSVSSVARSSCGGLSSSGRAYAAAFRHTPGARGWRHYCCVMRKWLGRAAAHLNRWEADAVAPSPVLPAEEPAPELTGLTTAARGGLLWVGMAAVLAIRRGRFRRAARNGVVAVALASGSSHVIGSGLPRRRPAADHLSAYQALVHKPTSSSFPSSHAATAAAFTTAVAWESPTAGLVVAPVAVAVAHSRLRTRAHWPSDVVAGALWGVAVGVATRRLLRYRPQPTASSSSGSSPE
jgi:membrane-associated phospholipid phosphatase